MTFQLYDSDMFEPLQLLLQLSTTAYPTMNYCRVKLCLHVKFQASRCKVWGVMFWKKIFFSFVESHAINLFIF